MKRKKFNYVILVILGSVLLSGCGNDVKDDNISVVHCTKTGEATGISASMEYNVYYKGDYVKILNSIETVTSNDSSKLDEYETAYKTIFKAYEGLEYYDNNITRTSNTVKSETTINYEKIDIDKLLSIEGEEDNVVEDGKVKLSTWINFAEKYGATCDNK